MKYSFLYLTSQFASDKSQQSGRIRSLSFHNKELFFIIIISFRIPHFKGRAF